AVNGNATMLDTILGGVGSIAVNPGDNHALTAAEIVNGTISVTGALTSSATITFPAGVMGWWTIENLCTGPGVLLAAVASGTEAIGLPPGEISDIQVHGTTVRYRNLGRVGSYLDIAAGTVPAWITASTIPPYLNCVGQAFSAATYPALAQFLGRTTLPNFIGTLPAILNQGSGVIEAARGGVDGDTLFARGTPTHSKS
uniref:tail fiber protein n=1 Tax=Bradyrhizobium sp. Ai1a-2 TaxID=196490 RepID=UPI0005B7F462